MPSTAAPSIAVLTSGIWQLSSVVLSDGGECLVVDPGYFPRELEELGRVACARGRVRASLFTHGHWDRVVGWQTFLEAEVWGSPSLAETISGDSPLAPGKCWRRTWPTWTRWPGTPRAAMWPGPWR